MNISLNDAETLISDLKEKEIKAGISPELWRCYENHIYGAAKVTQTIASHMQSINPNQIYIATLLHDICRTEEDREHRFHGVLGYEKLINKDETVARTALLHMFPWYDIPSYEVCNRFFFYNKKDYDFVLHYAQNTKPTDFDLLVQLADGLANKDGFVTLEERQREYFERRGYEMPKHVIQSVQK